MSVYLLYPVLVPFCTHHSQPNSLTLSVCTHIRKMIRWIDFHLKMHVKTARERQRHGYTCVFLPFAFDENVCACCLRAYILLGTYVFPHIYGSFFFLFFQIINALFCCCRIRSFSQSVINAWVLLLDHVLFRFAFFSFLCFHSSVRYYDWVYALVSSFATRYLLLFLVLFLVLFCFYSLQNWLSSNKINKITNSVSFVRI